MQADWRDSRLPWKRSRRHYFERLENAKNENNADDGAGDDDGDREIDMLDEGWWAYENGIWVIHDSSEFNPRLM